MNKKECSALRGIAIISIMLHNYCHWLSFAVPENEFSFDEWKYIQFWNDTNWETFFIQLFSFWGHLGVPIFVLLSGYGLVMKYDNTTIKWNSFIVKHYKKLFIPMVLGLIAYYIVLFIINYPNNHDLLTIIPIKRFVAQLSLIINFLPNPRWIILPGPYWYFGLTMQLYIIYLLFIYKRSIKTITAIALCIFLLSLFLENYPKLLISTKYNSIGWLFPFIYGVIMGRRTFKPSIHQTYSVVVITLFLIPLFAFSYFTWLLIPLLVAIMATHIIKIIPRIIINTFDVVGKQSLYLFVLHPITRELTIQYGLNGSPYFGLTLYLIISLTIAWGISKSTNIILHRGQTIK